MMKRIKKGLLWFCLLTKRLFKKQGYLITLALIPILSFAMSFFVKTEETGLMRIVLVAKDPEDQTVNTIFEKLLNDSDGNIFSFTVTKSQDDAKTMVENKTVDAAWVFEDEFSSKVEQTVKSGDIPLINVYAVCDSIFFKASREKIFAAIMPEISYEMYLEHTRLLLPQDTDITDEQLREYYDKYGTDERIVEFTYLDAEHISIEETNFLTSTIRGLLAVIMLLCGISSTMYFYSDEKQGIYSWLTAKKRLFVLLGSNFSALLIAGVFVFAALLLSGNCVSVARELIVMILFVVCTSAFCAVLGAACNSVGKLGLALPTVLLASLALCPIFFNINLLKPVQVLLPPYLYLYAINDARYIKWMAGYAVVAILTAYVLYCVVRNKETHLLKK